MATAQRTSQQRQPIVLEPRDYIRALQKRWVFITLFTLAVTFAGGVYSLTMPSKYIARARVLLRSPETRVEWLVAGPEGPRRRAGLSLDTYARMLVSSENARRVAQRLASRTSGQRFVLDASEVVRSLRAATEPPDIIRVEAEAPNPEQAIAIANEAADSFVSLVADFQRAQETAARQFVEEQLASTAEEMRKLREQLLALQERVGLATAITPASDQQVGTYVNLLSRYDDMLRQEKAQLRSLQAELRRVREQLASTPKEISRTVKRPNPTYETLRQQLASYRVALVDYQSRYTEDHPQVIEMKERIQALERELESTPRYVQDEKREDNPEYKQLLAEQRQLEQQLSAAQARVAEISSAVAQLRREARKATEDLERAQALRARLRLLESIYQRLLQDLQAHRLNEAMKSEVAAVLDRAVTAEARTPKLGRTMLFALVLGLAVACGLAIFLELIDDTIYDPDDLQRYVDVPYLGLIPRLEQEQVGLVVHEAPKSPPAEAYRAVRSQIKFQLWDKPGKVLLITSALAGEGKTLTAANLAVAFAQGGESVILLDTDLRRPAIHQLFNVDSTRGVSNVIVGDMPLEDVIVDTQCPGVRIVPSGPLPPNPAELLESAQMKKTVEQAREMADIVLLDSPPVLAMSDAAILAAMADHVIIVVQSGVTTARDIRRAVEVIEAARGSLLGAIINRVSAARGGYYYYYYYYYAYEPRE